MPLRRLHNSIAMKLGLTIMPVVILVFILSLGYLFDRSREMVRQEAIERADCMLMNTTLRVEGFLNELHLDTVCSYGQCGPYIASLPSQDLLQRLQLDDETRCMILDSIGSYILYTDTTEAISQTIFDNLDPLTQTDMIALGHEMTAGNKGFMHVFIDGESCLVFYRPLEQASWSIALIFTESDIFSSYNHLLYVLVPLMAVGLLLLLFFLRAIVNFFINPLNKLASQTRHIADGHFDVSMPTSNRTDAIGRLQNNFSAMQQYLSGYVRNLERVNEETEKRNAELVVANQQAEEAGQRQVAFLQDMLHQIRTPLNIIMGFVQVLRDDYASIPREEMNTITETMMCNATTITRMVSMLTAASSLDMGKPLSCNEEVLCVDLAHEAEQTYYRRLPITASLIVDKKVAEDVAVKINKDYFLKALNEMLHNAKKYSVVPGRESEALVTLRVTQDVGRVLFIVEDKGPGIPSDYHNLIFNQFIKVNSFSEGLGLGLFISKQFAKMMGGDLTLDESYTEGARFVLAIPA